MRTPLCDLFGIEYPIFAFTHCRDVVAAVSKAGGMGVLGAVGFSPEQLEVELDWVDEHIDGKPYGVDIVMPQKAVDVHGDNAEDLMAQIRGMIDDAHWKYVDELMERFELPPLPDGEGAHGVIGWAEDVARQHVEVAFAHPMKLIANALGSPPVDIIERAHEAGVKVAALAGKASTPSDMSTTAWTSSWPRVTRPAATPARWRPWSWCPRSSTPSLPQPSSPPAASAAAVRSQRRSPSAPRACGSARCG
jgi:NAD(P)H-dependent flavin oxidoreductase YrpB (nitropropane dioxygenase family)